MPSTSSSLTACKQQRAKKKKKKVRLLREEPPTTAALARIDSFEADPEAGGLDIGTWAELLLLLLPGPVHGYHPSAPADRPTRHPPGSEEKIQVMARRARLGMSVHHEGDEPCDERGEPR
jgi:hypothetical protein